MRGAGWATVGPYAVAMILIGIVLAGCASPSPSAKRAVLLAPFEGNLREIGYDMLYPIRLALTDAQAEDITLLSLDAGDSPAAAARKAAAFADDPTVLLALVAGAQAADPQVLTAFGDVPVIVIGDWNAVPSDRIFVLASADLHARLTSTETDIYTAAGLKDATGGETFGLKAFARLAGDTAKISVATSASPASADLQARLESSALFVPEAGLLATIAYDAGTLTAAVLSEATTREAVALGLQETRIEGLNGVISFGSDGYWANAPIYTYVYVGDTLRLKAD